MVIAANHVHIVRVFNAPREAVFRAWTDREWLSRWFSPPGCQLEIHRLDARVGGELVTTITAPGDSSRCSCLATFAEFDPPRRLAYSWSFCDAQGRYVPASEVGREDWPDQMMVTVDLVEVPEGTQMTLRQTVDAELAQKTGALPSWHLMFDRLAQEVS